MDGPSELPIKEYGAAALIFLLLIGGWLMVPLGPGLGSDAVFIERELESERGLRYLDKDGNPIGAPGRPGGLNPAQASSLYQARAERDSAAPAIAAKSAKAAGRPTIQPMGITGFGEVSSAGGGASAVPFGSGGDPGLREAQASRAGSAAGGAPARTLDLAGSRAFGSLRQAAQATNKALEGGDERAFLQGQKTFDMAGQRAQALFGPGLQSGSGAGVAQGQTPLNLKGNDPSLDIREIGAPPAVGEAGEIRVKDEEYMKQQLMMMLVSLAMNGMLGPVFGAIGEKVTKGVKLDLPAGKQDKVKTPAPLPKA